MKTLKIRVLYNQNQQRFFANADTGLILGACVGGLMQFGEDPSRTQQRMYVDNDHAIRAMKAVINEAHPGFLIEFLPEEYRADPQRPPQMPPGVRAQ